MEFLPEHLLPIRQYRFTIQADEDIRWPDYAGSMLRGSFGHSLRAVSCLTDSKECNNCPLMAGCQYIAIFNPLPKPELGSRYTNTPAPYLMRVDTTKGQELKSGDMISFEMVVFGEATQQISLLILAWQRACFTGLGKGKGRAHLKSVEVFQPDQSACFNISGDWQQIFNNEKPAVLPHDGHFKLPELSHRGGLRLCFKTPTRIQHCNKYLNSHALTVKHLFQALARKVELYTHTYLKLDLGPPPAIPEPSGFKKRLTVYQWQRYSNRQKQMMKFDGLVGEVEIDRLDEAWLTWLWIGQFTHLGKNTTFGLGHYTVQTIPSENIESA